MIRIPEIFPVYEFAVSGTPECKTSFWLFRITDVLCMRSSYSFYVTGYVLNNGVRETFNVFFPQQKLMHATNSLKPKTSNTTGIPNSLRS